MMNIWKQAKELIGAGALAPALELLSQHLGPDIQNELILFRANLTYLEREERLFEADISDKKNRLIIRVLQFIMVYEAQENKQMNTSVTSIRKERLIKRQLKAYLLLEKWEEKLEISENPNEIRRSEIEIERLKNILDKYTEEIDSI